MDNQQNLNTLVVTIKNPDTTLFQGEVKALTSVNERGKFDILPRHANFISLIKDFILLHKNDGGIEKIQTESGIMRVIRNKVSVFLGIETLR